ncbi:PREDICTED: MLP-like protein 31 [Camelina sativa]|uniref:MLP-like protein 31 n=1 Tax=Camelina sativa TaxID=90675 RepID=A0ABM0WXK6_CAMSA|nr:PREDICTED: MLP-like protein 31 [Camelina sativa]
MAQATRQSSLEGELEVDVEIKASAKKFHQMLAGTPQDLAKATPDNIQGCAVREGEFGKVGSIIFWNYAIDGQPKVAKERIEAVDQEKNLLVLRVIDGDMIKGFKRLLITVQATPNIRGHGSVVKCHLGYERIDEKVAHPEDLLTLFVKGAKDIDKMLFSQV